MKNIDKYNLIIINSLFIIFPISMILGNLFINLNTLLFCFSTLFFLKKKTIKFDIIFFDKIILIFFFYTFLTLFINNFEGHSSENKMNYLYWDGGEYFPKYVVYKTLSYLRYLILYLVIRVLMSQNILRLNWFSWTCAACAAFVLLDIFFQSIFGKNLFGMIPIGDRHYSGVFGEELIAGGYLQKFALFFLFLPFVLKKSTFQKFIIQLIIFIIFVLGISLTGNRMPLVLFIFSFFIYFLLINELRKYFFALLIFVFLFLSLNFSLNQTFKKNILTFYVGGVNLVNTFFVKDIAENSKLFAVSSFGYTAEKIKDNSSHLYDWQRPYVTEFQCFKIIWKKNPIFGGGLRSYRTHVGGCNTHPHNYYFEILSDLGLLGLSIILIFVFMLLRDILIKKNNITKLSFNVISNKIMPFFLIFFIEFFPLRTSGSFFSTSSATVIFIVLPILVSLISIKKNYKY
jgi:O-antigen ligase